MLPTYGPSYQPILDVPAVTVVETHTHTHTRTRVVTHDFYSDGMLEISTHNLFCILKTEETTKFLLLKKTKNNLISLRG